MEKGKEKKRIYLSRSQQKEIIRSFFTTWQGKEFGRNEFRSWLNDNYDWFKKSDMSIQDSRIENLISIMKQMYGEGLEQQQGGQPGVPTRWLLPLVASEILEPEKETKPKPKREKAEKPKARHCSLKRIKSFYYAVLFGAKPLGGMTRKDLALIMGYRNDTVSRQGVQSLNNLIQIETGFRPLKFRKSAFADIDVIYVEPEESKLIIDELIGKLGGEPEEPETINEYENIVKPVMRADYRTLKMFENSSSLLCRTDEASKFKKSILTDCKVIISEGNRNSMEDIVRAYTKALINRYGVELNLCVVPRKEILLEDSEDTLNNVLKTIEDKFAECFCEDIIPHELTVLGKELRRESEPDQIEQNIIKIVEMIFCGKSGSLPTSQIWERLSKHHIERKWDLLGVLKKSDRFTIRTGSEPIVVYTAPEDNQPQINTVTETSGTEDENLEEKDFQENPQPQTEERERVGTSEIIYFGFMDEGTMNEFCNEKTTSAGLIEEIDDDGAYKMCAFYASDNMDKKAILLLLKMYYMSLASDKVKMIYHNKNLLVKKLEWKLLK